MNFIRKIIEGQADNWVRKNFVRYGKGTYEWKAMLNLKKGKSSNTIKTSWEFAGELAYNLANSINGKTKVTGGIITKKKIEDEVKVPIANIKQFAGIKTYLIDAELSKEDIQGLYDQYPTSVIFLSFKTDEGEIKTKVKNPKPAKAGKEDPKANFCTFKTKDESLINDFAFDVEKKFSRVQIKHTFQIDELSIPDEYKDDFAMARKMAVRKGKLIREMDIDGTKVTKEYPLEV
jgi:hypothetical protein